METGLRERLLLKTKRYMRLLQRCPFVRFAAVCNNVAMDNVNEGSDVDLFFVMKKGRLFTGRFLVTLLLHVLGVRRHGDKISGRFCLSFFVDEDALLFSDIAIKDDYYLAHWCKTMIPFIDRGVGERIEAENSWIPSLKLTREYLLPQREPFFEFLFPDFIENLLAKWQKSRALKKIMKLPRPHGIIVNDHMLKFHDVDRRHELRDKMKAISGISL